MKKGSVDILLKRRVLCFVLRMKISGKLQALNTASDILKSYTICDKYAALALFGVTHRLCY
jgi:hypothetical protein